MHSGAHQFVSDRVTHGLIDAVVKPVLLSGILSKTWPTMSRKVLVIFHTHTRACTHTHTHTHTHKDTQTETHRPTHTDTWTHTHSFTLINK